MKTIGELPPREMAMKLRELGYIDEAELVEVQLDSIIAGDIPASAFDIGKILNQGLKPWQHTAHAYGYIPPTGPGTKLVDITHAGNMNADDTLKNGRITIRLNTMRIADYPGKGIHRVLFDFSADNHIDGQQVEKLRFTQTYRAQEGETVGIIGYPIFIGLNVGKLGVSFRCWTVNVQNDNDEAVLNFLKSSTFTSGLKLITTAQPAIAPLTDMASGIAEMVAKRNQNVSVQDINMGLDFDKGPGGARLAEGEYIAVQIPQQDKVIWKWDEWAFDPSSGLVVNKADSESLIPYNYVSFKVSKYSD
jgi:hypothetical protein